ncbi:MAG: T9SS type A sorting domain-containing protein [Chitinophagaceae bacterium]|nr:T9SS type A sorting domain-containing protein [Chitinophagaceae bacterium]
MKNGSIITICLSLLAFFLPQKSKAQSISGIVNSYHKATYYKSSYNGIHLQNISGLSINDRVLIIQMKGAVINESGSSSFGSITSLGGAGTYEFATICGFLNDTVLFKKRLVNTYDFTKAVQVIKVPVYTDVTVSSAIVAGEWNPVTETGGVLAIEASGTITLNAAIRADSAGFKGGGMFVNTTSSGRCGEESPSAWYYSSSQSSNPNLGGAPKGEGVSFFIPNKEYGRGKQSNGGGGGNVDETGGGGGANYGTGGAGGNKSNSFFCSAATHGEGGLDLSGYGYSITNNKLFPGGGGGCGEMNNFYSGTNGAGTPGGDGGGLVFIKCNTLVGNSQVISANGGQGINPGMPVKTEGAGDGGGGGGAGGAVILQVTNYSGNITIQARGAAGSNVGFQDQCPGPGGGGGGGVIWANSILPGTVTTNINGGAAGVIKNAPSHNPPCEGTTNGALAGSSGVVLNNYAAVEGTEFFDCDAILDFVSLVHWSGTKIENDIQLNWQLVQTESLQEVRLEKKTGEGIFTTVQLYTEPSEGQYRYTDRANGTPAVYRLQFLLKNRQKQYSANLFFDQQRVKQLSLFPNPVSEQLQVSLPAEVKGKASILVTDISGKKLLQHDMFFTNHSSVAINLQQLSPGTYFVQLFWKGEQYISKLIKQ